MKYTLLFLALSFSFFCVSAQNGNNAASKTSSVTRERLVAYSFHYPPSNPIPWDTIAYYYSGENGSDTVDMNLYLLPQVVTPNHQTIKCDSFIYKYNTYARGIYTYNASGDAMTFTYEDTAGTGALSLKRYNSWDYVSGRISADSLWATIYNYNRYHVYDGSGYLVLDSLVNPATHMPTGKTEYTNNAAGSVLTATGYGMTSGIWVPSSRTINSYDASNRLINRLVQDYTSSVWTNYRHDSFYYAVPGNKYTCQTTTYWTSGAWEPYVIYACHVNTAHQWDSMYTYSWNSTTLSYDTGARQYITYDAYGNMKSSGNMDFNTSTHTYADTAVDLNIYYYETYTYTKVAGPAAPGAVVNIFPNPVSGTLHVNMEGLAAGKKADFTITDVLGRRIMCSEIMDGSNLMNVSALGAGMYIVTVSGDGVKFAERLVKIE